MSVPLVPDVPWQCRRRLLCGACSCNRRISAARQQSPAHAAHPGLLAHHVRLLDAGPAPPKPPLWEAHPHASASSGHRVCIRGMRAATLTSKRKTPARCAWCTTRCARGVGVFHVHGQLFLSPCAVFCTSPTALPWQGVWAATTAFGEEAGVEASVVVCVPLRPPRPCHPEKKLEKCRRGLLETPARCTMRCGRCGRLSLS